MHKYIQPMLSFLGVLFILLLQVHPSGVFSPESYIGSETRDLFDHIALLDHWSWTSTDWNFPVGGRLIPPDLYSMLFALPWWSLGSGVAHDMAIVTHLCCNALAGWYLGKTVGGSPWVGAVALLCAPYALGQINSGETETIGLWGLTMSLTLLIQHKWRWSALWAIITAIGSWYYGAYAATIVGLYSLWKYTVDRTDTTPLTAPLTMGMGILIPAWLYNSMLQDPLQMFRGPTMTTYLQEHPRALAAFSSDPTLWLSEVPQDATHIDSVGWTFTLLGLWGLWQLISHTSFRKQWGWVLLMLGALSLSLGPRLYVSQSVLWEWMPYDLWMMVPPLENMRLPHRWMAVVTIVLSGWIARGGKNMPLLACFILWGESSWFMPTIERTELPTPEIIEHFKGPVLQLPTRTMEWDARGRYLVMQRTHRQPIPYSLLMQGWSKPISEEPLVVGITALDGKDPISSRTVEARQFRQEDFALEVTAWGGFSKDTPQEQTNTRLKNLGIQQVCLHRDLIDTADREGMETLLVNTLGVPTIATPEAWLWTL